MMIRNKFLLKPSQRRFTGREDSQERSLSRHFGWKKCRVYPCEALLEYRETRRSEEIEMSRHWFITGASGGLGRHLVALALAEGDAVVATVRRPNALSELSKTYGERLMVEPLDVTDREQVTRVIARCLARGRIDIVVNNAGGGLIGATEEMTDAQVQEQIALNLLKHGHDPLYAGGGFRRLACTFPQAVTRDGPCRRHSR